MRRVLATLGEVPELETPIEFAITESARRPPRSTPFDQFKTKPLVINAISQVFGEVVVLERGTIWALPTFQDNARLCLALLERFAAFREIQTSLLSESKGAASATIEPALTAVPSSANVRDVFISHASEDKAEIARPLAESLKQRGLSVWFDEYQLTLGDRLRRKIEEGLRVSRYGVAILSDNFFRKKWPQEELDGLFSLETTSKKILPVWHRLSAADIAHYAPLLADRLAVSTDIGVDAVADEILRAVRQ